MHSVILPEPESSQTPPHPSSLTHPTNTSNFSVTTFCQFLILNQGSQTNIHRGQKDKLNKADAHEVYGLVGKRQTGEQIPLLKRASTI